jgi:UDP-N-acetyl-D-glucosamine dehydrogenase
MELLFERKAKVDYYDPYVPHLTPTRDYDFQMSSIDISAEKLTEYDIVILTTDHDTFDYEMIVDKSQILVDTRGRYQNNVNVIRA